MITDNFRDVIDFSNKTEKKIGLWNVHTEIHDGHRFCYDLIKQRSEVVIGMYWLNWQWAREIIGAATPVLEIPINHKTVDEFSEKCDLVFVMQGRDFGKSFGMCEKEARNLLQRGLKEYPDNLLPDSIRNDKEVWASLRTSQVLRVKLNEFVRWHVITGSLKDSWRIYIHRWHTIYYPEKEYLLIDPVQDQYGNSFCSSMPKEIFEQIKKPLLLPHFRTIEEVKEHISDINELKITSFSYDPEVKYIYGRFSVGTNYWNFGIKAGE
jgi:hypothetical protein